MLQTPSRSVQRFVSDIYAAVPNGTESSRIDMDDLVAYLLDEPEKTTPPRCRFPGWVFVTMVWRPAPR